MILGMKLDNDKPKSVAKIDNANKPPATAPVKSPTQDPKKAPADGNRQQQVPVKTDNPA
jgi:hypothetical protein